MRFSICFIFCLNSILFFVSSSITHDVDVDVDDEGNYSNDHVVNVLSLMEHVKDIFDNVDISIELFVRHSIDDNEETNVYKRMFHLKTSMN